MDNKKEKRCSFALIDSLCGDLCEVKVMPHPVKRIVPWIVFAVLYIAVSVASFGLRHDFAQQILNPVYMFEMILVSVLAISAALCSVWLCIPDMRGQKWMLAVPFVLFGVFAVWTILRSILVTFFIPTAVWHICYFEAFVFGVIPALMIFIVTARGRTTHPYLLSFMNSFAFGGFGYLGLRLTCASENMGHITMFHILPYILFGLLASVLGRKIYRW